MATAGLSFANPMLGSMGVGEEPNPYAPYSPTSSIGAGGLAPSAADMAVMGEALAKQSQFTMPEMRRPPAIAFSPTSKQLFVNGLTFAADDAASALQSESYLRGPGTQLPTGGDWVPLDEQAYGQYLQSIRQPSLGRLASKSFGRGVDTMQSLIGRGLQLAGAEETGGRIVAAQEEDLRKTSPYERQFTDIESGRGAVEWFVANLAQQGPNLIESVALGLAGAAVGTAAAGPVGTAVGGLAGAFGKKAFKDKVMDAAQKVASGQAKPGSTEYALLRNTAAVAGATAANFSGNIATGAANPWITSPTGQVTPNTNTALGGLFQAQNQQLEQLMPNITAPITGASIATGQFGSLRGQTAEKKALADAQAQLFSDQMKAALQNQSTGVNAAANVGNITQQDINNLLTVGQYQQAAPFTNISNLGKVIGGIQAPTSVSNQTQVSPLNQILGIATALGGTTGNTGLLRQLGVTGGLPGIITGAKKLLTGSSNYTPEQLEQIAREQGVDAGDVDVGGLTEQQLYDLFNYGGALPALDTVVPPTDYPDWSDYLSFD